MSLLEIACFTAENAIAAWRAGADRIELCDCREVGGTTPSLEAILAVRKLVDIPVFVMIRPRGGDFYFSEPEIEQMKADIDRFKPLVDGFVFGILTERSAVDVEKTAELVRLAHPRPCTFHRAFDETKDPYQAFDDVVATGCHAILSSGGCSNAVSGASVLRDLVQRAQGHIAIVPGGGVRSRNLSELKGRTGAGVFHSSALVNQLDEPEAAEIELMKKLLRDDVTEPTHALHTGTQPTHDGDTPDDAPEGSDTPHMTLSAVSIGATPPEEVD